MVVKQKIQPVCFLICGLLVATASTLDGAPSKEKIAKIKAAYLLNFLKFSTWPEDAFEGKESPIIVGVLGDDPFGTVLEQTFRDRSVHDRHLVIQRHDCPAPKDFIRDEQYRQAVERTVSKLQQCHMLFVSDLDSRDRRRVFGKIDDKHILAVGNERECAKRGTQLALDQENDKIVFYANVEAIDRINVKISSKLLRLANIVESDEDQDR